MEPKLYTAAQLGNWDVIKEFERELYKQVTPKRYNVLHLLTQFCDSSFAVEQVLKSEPRLLLERNSEHEIALHIAARKAHVNVVPALINCAKQRQKARNWSLLERLRVEGPPGLALKRQNLLMYMLAYCKDQDGNTALHEAVRSNCYEIVRILVEADPEISYGPNGAGESPLYIAVEKGYQNIAELILSTCKSPSYRGPDERTALHASAIWDRPELMQLILKKHPELAKKVDRFGRTALHYAATFNHLEIVRKLVSEDRKLGYQEVVIMPEYVSRRLRLEYIGYFGTPEHGGTDTALHVAVARGHLEITKELLSSCPDSWYCLTSSHRNIIHVAVANEQAEVLEFILNQSWAENLINQKNRDGNTPLHLYAATEKLLGHSLVNHHKVDVNAFNDDGLTPLDRVIGTDQVLTERRTYIKDELVRAGGTRGRRNIISRPPKVPEPEDIARMVETYMIVFTLILTVCFAAAFTLPGGYESNDKPGKGRAILVRKPAFIMFIMSDLVAMYYSLDGVLLIFVFQTAISQMEKLHCLDYCRFRIGISLAAMLLAMLTGLYATLPTLGMKILIVAYAIWVITCLRFFEVIKKGNFYKIAGRWPRPNRRANYRRGLEWYQAKAR